MSIKGNSVPVIQTYKVPPSMTSQQKKELAKKILDSTKKQLNETQNNNKICIDDEKDNEKISFENDIIHLK